MFVNGRLIRDRVLMHALSAAYHNLMPPACFPFALLFLDCDCEEVDVNVHPSKTEVRFRHGTVVHDFVRDSLRGPFDLRSPGFEPAGSPRSTAGRRSAFFRFHAAHRESTIRADPGCPGACRRSARFPSEIERRSRAAFRLRERRASAGPGYSRPAPGRDRELRKVSGFFPTFGRSARFTTASSSPPDAMASGSSISTSPTNESCSKRCCASRPIIAWSGSIC